MRDPESINIEIGRRLAARRRELRLTLSDVAVLCEVSLQQIKKYEAGETAISARMLWRISDALEAPVGYFFEGIERDLDAPARSSGWIHPDRDAAAAVVATGGDRGA